MLLFDIPVGVMVGIIECGKYRDKFTVSMVGTLYFGLLHLDLSLFLLRSLSAFHLTTKRILMYL